MSAAAILRRRPRSSEQFRRILSPPLMISVSVDYQLEDLGARLAHYTRGALWPHY